jgi:branched-chain amino acid transport system substrate-binding protein
VTFSWKRATALAMMCTAGVAAGCGSSSDDGGSKTSANAGSTAASTTPSSSATKPATGAPITIGEVSDSTGPLGASNGAWPKGLAVWAKWTNDHGGILGHKVVIEERDSKSDVTTLLTQVKDVLADPKLVAYVPGSSQGIPISKLIAASKVPAVGGLTGDPLGFTNPNVFPAGTTGDQLANAIAAIGVAKKGKGAKAADLYCVESPACKQSLPLFKSGVQKAGGQFVYQGTISATAPDYTAQCVAAQQKGASIVWISHVGDVIARVAADCAKNNFKPQYVSPQYGSSLLKVPALDGMAVASPVAGPDSAAAKEFNEAVAKYDAGLLDKVSSPTFAVQAWATGKLIEAAIKAANPTGTPTAADVRKGLYALKDETLGGLTPPLNYTEGKPTSIPCYFSLTLTGGKAVQDGSEAACPAGQ